MAISTTYTPIQVQTLSSNSKTVTFSSIPSTYTDLVLVMNYTLVKPASCKAQFNGDTNANYSYTELRGNGSAASSTRGSNQTFTYFAQNVFPDTTPGNSIMYIQNYSDSSMYKTLITRTNANTGSYPGSSAIVGLWRSTSAINSITLDMDGDSTYWYQSGSTFALYGIAAAPAAGSNKATGGTITVGSGYTYHTFTSGGTFTPSQNITADVLLIAGGGGGGSYSGGGGGGGAGGVLLLANQSLTSGTGYTVSVGGGGAANTNGQNSYFGALTQAVGGGKGGSASAGGNGGSGGGAGDTGFAAGTGTAGQGFNGGTGTGAGSSPGGGGGGALEAGQNAFGDATPNIAGKGGSGTNFYYDWAAATSTGVSGYFAGGGGGGVYINSSFANNGGGAGGNGGGGSGSASNKNATANTGSGGGGGSYTSGPVAAGNGGSGLVIVRYAN